MGLLSNLMPGYLNMPKDSEPTFADYMKTRRFKPLRPGQTSYWQNYRKFFVSLQKSIYGAAATADNDWAYDYLPKLDVPGYDILRAFDMMHTGKINGYICQGFNPLQAFPNKKKIRAALGKLKFLVVMDPLETETARFWENHGETRTRRTRRRSQTEVFLLPTTCFAEEDGSADQLLALAAMALEGGRSAGRGAQRHRHHVGPVPAHARDCTGRTAARSPIRSSTSAGVTPTRSSRGRTRSRRR